MFKVFLILGFVDLGVWAFLVKENPADALFFIYLQNHGLILNEKSTCNCKLK